MLASFLKAYSPARYQWCMMYGYCWLRRGARALARRDYQTMFSGLDFFFLYGRLAVGGQPRQQHQYASVICFMANAFPPLFVQFDPNHQQWKRIMQIYIYTNYYIYIGLYIYCFFKYAFQKRPHGSSICVALLLPAPLGLLSCLSIFCRHPMTRRVTYNNMKEGKQLMG